MNKVPDNLTQKASDLLKSQKLDWELLALGYESLKQVKTKTISFDQFDFLIQYNPGRLKSTSAKTDLDSINGRECFLCAENRPSEQRSIKLPDNFELLANPFPIFPEHFTIVSMEHQPQDIQNSLSSMLLFSKLLSDKYTLFYNGPECGASAPDHLHFQACSKGVMPIERNLRPILKKYSKAIVLDNHLYIHAADDHLRRFIVIESPDEKKIIETFVRIYRTFALEKDAIEPCMNIISMFDKTWKLIIMLREKHRPKEYFYKGDRQLMFSPAGADYAGLSVLPVEKDFVGMTPKLLKRIFSQTTLNNESFQRIVDYL